MTVQVEEASDVGLLRGDGADDLFGREVHGPVSWAGSPLDSPGLSIVRGREQRGDTDLVQHGRSRQVERDGGHRCGRRHGRRKQQRQGQGQCHRASSMLRRRCRNRGHRVSLQYVDVQAGSTAVTGCAGGAAMMSSSRGGTSYVDPYTDPGCRASWPPRCPDERGSLGLVECFAQDLQKVARLFRRRPDVHEMISSLAVGSTVEG